jgi:MFS family permease
MDTFSDSSSIEETSSTEVPLTPAKKRRFFINRDFALLWTGQTISELGSHITGTGLPLVANLVLGATAVQMGLLTAAGMLPVLLIGLLAGVWVDRLRRRPILIVADLSRAFLLLSIPVAAVFGWLGMGQLYVVAVLVGVLTVFFEVANRSFLPVVVKREHIVEGNSKLSASSSLAEVGGPVLAGGLVQAITAPLAILFDALSFLLSALCVGFICTREPEPVVVIERQRLWHEMEEGLRLVLGNPVLRAIALSSSTRSFFGGTFAALYGLFLIRELSVTPTFLGILIAAGGVGALLGAFMARPLVRRFGIGKVLIGSTLLSGAMMPLTPLAGGPWIMVALMLLLAQLVGDFAYEVYNIHTVSLLQTLVPDRFLGRASASMQFLVEGMVPIGALLAGLVAEVIGMRPTLLIASILAFLLSSALLIFSPVRRLREPASKENY